MAAIITLIQKPERETLWEVLLNYLAAKSHAMTQTLTLQPVSLATPEQQQERFHRDFSFCTKLLRGLLDDVGVATVIVDGVDPAKLNPNAEPAWETLISRLILSFPEVRWLFSRIDPEDDAFKKMHGMHRIFGADIDPLFDADGLREHVRSCARKQSEAAYLPRRWRRAVSLDEETAYAALHSYSAYRQGFLGNMLTTFGQTQEVLGSKSIISNCDLVFEDIYVNFPDTTKCELSKLYRDPHPDRVEGRNENKFTGRVLEWPILERVPYRVFVTSGQHPHSESGKWLRNREYIAEQKSAGKYIRTLLKPYAGIYRLWNGSGLNRKLRWTDKQTGKQYYGVADGYVWPPERSSFADGSSGHSSPGALLQIADHLTARAELLLKNVASVEDAVRGAVLATDALELLGCRTPTQSIEALRLKHKFELLAECQFSGVEHHVCIKERIAEIRRDIKAISYWFGPRKRKLAAWNAEAQILTDLVRILREHGHFDEEQHCMTTIRRAMRKIWLHEARPWSFLGYPFRWYVEILLDRPVYFAGALSLWAGALYWFFILHGAQEVNGGSSPESHGWKVSIHETIATFFQTEIPENLVHWWAVVVSVLAVLFGFVHLGIFISHLYTQVSRR